MERKRDTGTCTSFQENQSASTDRQVERERERKDVFFLNFVIFLTLRTCLRISVSCISLQKILIDEMSLSDCMYYGKCSKISNTLKLQTPKIIAENNF